MTNSISELILGALRPRGGHYHAVLDAEPTLNQSPSRQNYQRLAKIAVLVVPFWFLLLYLNFQQPTFRSSSKHGTRHISAAFLHFLLPAATGSTPYCRTLFSAGALNYPTPRLINWERKFNDAALQDGGMSLGKIDGVLDFLKQLDASHDDELVLVADGYDTWFQLRPEVLLQRYFAVKERARRRVWPRYGLQYDTAIIFAAQKHCEMKADAWGCTAIPPSPLSADIYGSRTDHVADDAMNPHLYQRPRYLSSAMIIGPVGKMRNLYEYAQNKLENGTFTNDQAVFSEIFGEQEYFREMIMANTSRVPEGALADDPRDGMISGEKLTLDCDQCQFGIGLDYFYELSMPTMYSEPHIKYTTHNATGVLKLSEDIRHSTPPYWTPDYSGETELPGKSWTELPLAEDQNTNVVPVAMHFHAGSNTTDMWPRQWYSDNLRELVTGHAKSFRIPFAVLSTGNDDVREYWGPNDGYGGVRIHDPAGLPGHWMQWDEICGGVDVGNDIFRDAKGAYQCPVYYLYWDANKQNQQLDTWWERIEEEQKPNSD